MRKAYNLLICYLGLLFRKFIKNEKSVLNVLDAKRNFDKNFSKLKEEDCFIIDYKVSEEERKRLYKSGMSKEEFLSKYMYFKPISLEEFKKAGIAHEMRLLSDPEYRAADLKQTERIRLLKQESI
jgi:hypothetical protein